MEMQRWRCRGADAGVEEQRWRSSMDPPALHPSLFCLLFIPVIPVRWETHSEQRFWARHFTYPGFHYKSQTRSSSYHFAYVLKETVLYSSQSSPPSVQVQLILFLLAFCVHVGSLKFSTTRKLHELEYIRCETAEKGCGWGLQRVLLPQPSSPLGTRARAALGTAGMLGLCFHRQVNPERFVLSCSVPEPQLGAMSCSFSQALNQRGLLEGRCREGERGREGRKNALYTGM